MLERLTAFGEVSPLTDARRTTSGRMPTCTAARWLQFERIAVLTV